MHGQFDYHLVARHTVQGPSLAEENFIPEEKTDIETLIRETIQNVLDAKRPDLPPGAPVQLTLRLLKADEYDHPYLVGLLGDEYLERLKKASNAGEAVSLENLSVLVIEDFGTTGLTGVTGNSNTDGPRENWNAFWFREGEGAKGAGGSNGRAGQGKITYYRLSRLRVIFGLTVRQDGRRLLLGRSTLVNNYIFGDSDAKWDRYAYWGLQDESGQPLPVEDAARTGAFIRAFRLRREDQCGLSLVIPAPAEFEVTAAVRAAVQEFYLPILRGRLALTVGDIDITAANVAALADQYLQEAEEVRAGASPVTSPEYRQFLGRIAEKLGEDPDAEMPRSWGDQKTIPETVFPAERLEQLREHFNAGEIVRVRFPVRVSQVNGASTYGNVEVYLQKPAELTQSQEVYMRQDLMISGEHYLDGSMVRARGLTYISDPVVSDFLAEAEEPTHLKWNGRRPRLVRKYRSPGITLTQVRNAMPRLLRLLTGTVTADDRLLLSRYFSGVPETPDDRPARTPGKKEPGRTTPPGPPVDVPRRPPARFRIVASDAGENWIEVRGEPGTATVTSSECTLELAYLNSVGIDPFDDYDPFDFDLSRTDEFPVEAEGIVPGTLVRDENRLRFLAGADPVKVRVSGFDRNIRLQSRLSYREVNTDAEDQQEE